MKRDVAVRAGALAAVDGSRSDAVSQIAAFSDGGVPGVLDLVGTPQTLQLGLDALAKGGKLFVVGMFGGELALSIPLFLLRGLTLQSSYVGSPAEMAEMMALVRRKGCPRIPITERSLSCANAALDDLRAGRVIGRTVLVPDRVKPVQPRDTA